MVCMQCAVRKSGQKMVKHVLFIALFGNVLME